MTTQNLTCKNHPSVETGLRCITCSNLICAKCAIHSPTGYRCKQCVRGHRARFNTTRWFDYISGFITTGSLSYLAGYLPSVIGFWSLFIGAFIGTLIASIVFKITQNRRSSYLAYVMIIAFIIGLVPHIVTRVVQAIAIYSSSGTLSIFDLYRIGIVLAFSLLAGSTLWYRLRGIVL